MKGSLLAIVLGFCLGAPSASDAQAPRPDWPFRDGDAAASRFSPLTQITPGNVSTLAPAWSFDTGQSNLQLTPVVVGGVMYVAAGKNIWALEPETAKVLWTFEAPDPVSRRGVGVLAR